MTARPPDGRVMPMFGTTGPGSRTHDRAMPPADAVEAAERNANAV